MISKPLIAIKPASSDCSLRASCACWGKIGAGWQLPARIPSMLRLNRLDSYGLKILMRSNRSRKEGVECEKRSALRGLWKQKYRDSIRYLPILQESPWPLRVDSERLAIFRNGSASSPDQTFVGSRRIPYAVWLSSDMLSKVESKLLQPILET